MTRDFTQYEKARVIGARALQIAMNAPLLIKITQEDLEKINFDALKIAEVEFDSGVLPISIKEPMPKKKQGKLKRIKIKEMTDAQKKRLEEETEKEIKEEGEIMELAKSEDEVEKEISPEEAARKELE